jgi:KDO2-lipid IV(A) lauroyltransferase
MRYSSFHFFAEQECFEIKENESSKRSALSVRAFMAFAKSIRPGWRANTLAGLLIFLLKALGIRKKVAQYNIQLCFPDKTPRERARIISGSYSSMVWTGVELLAWQKDPSLIDRMAAEVSGRSYIDEALAAGHGVIMFSAHIGSWEYGAAWLARNYHCQAVVRHSDSAFQRELIEEMREASGLVTISKDASMKRVITLLRHNGVFAVLADQHGGNEGIPVPFFGHTTSSAAGPAFFSMLTGAPMIPLLPRRIAPFKFSIEISKPLPAPDKSLSRNEAAAELTASMNREYERMITEDPGQWLWQHRRFREEMERR